MESYKDALHDWVEDETRQLDLVASWESLCETYRALEFSDQLTDSVRMEEFKWIVKEMNKHLTRARRKLMTCKDAESTRDALAEMYSTATQVSSRQELAYHKLRQMWVGRMLATLGTVMETMETTENGGQDGGPGY